MRAVKSGDTTNGRERGNVKALRREAPHVDVGAERSFVGGCLLKPELIDGSGITPSDFYSEKLAIVWDAVLQLHAAGEHVDADTVTAHLADRGLLERVGGDGSVMGLTDTIPAGDHFAKRVRLLSRRRTVEAAVNRLTVDFADEDSAPHALAAFDRARAELDALARERRVPTIAECIPKIALIGPRLPFGLAKLDEVTRGGVPQGKLISMVGAPGASKTNFSAWLMDAWERAGCACAFIAADEPRDTIITRLGQLDGFDRERLESSDDGRRNAFRARVTSRPMLVIDPFEDRVSLEQAEHELIAIAGNRPRVLIVDSIQRVPCEAANAYDQKREQVEAVMTVLDHIARRGTVVVAISEMSRAAYRSGKGGDVAAIASGAESRAVEYYASLHLTLRAVKGEVGLIDVEVGKNRLGQDKPDFRMKVDFQRLRFEQTARPEPQEEEIEHDARKQEDAARKILAAVSRDRTIRASDKLLRAAKVKRQVGLRALRELIQEGVIQKVSGAYRPGPRDWEQE